MCVSVRVARAERVVTWPAYAMAMAQDTRGWHRRSCPLALIILSTCQPRVDVCGVWGPRTSTIASPGHRAGRALCSVIDNCSINAQKYPLISVFAYGLWHARGPGTRSAERGCQDPEAGGRRSERPARGRRCGAAPRAGAGARRRLAHPAPPPPPTRRNHGRGARRTPWRPKRPQAAPF